MQDTITKPLVKMDKSSRRTYKDSKGNKLPGVTTILGVISKPQLIPWAWNLGKQGIDYKKVSGDAADVGTICHFMCECYLKNQEPDLSEFPNEQVILAGNGFRKFLKFWEAAKLKVLHTEIQLIHEELGYGGSLDIVCQDDEGSIVLLDLKTSKAIYSGYWSQVAAYSKLWTANKDVPINRHIIVRIGKDEAMDLEVIEKNDMGVYWTIFEGALMIYNAQNKVKDL